MPKHKFVTVKFRAHPPITFEYTPRRNRFQCSHHRWGLLVLHGQQGALEGKVGFFFPHIVPYKASEYAYSVGRWLTIKNNYFVELKNGR